MFLRQGRKIQKRLVYETDEDTTLTASETSSDEQSSDASWKKPNISLISSESEDSVIIQKKSVKKDIQEKKLVRKVLKKPTKVAPTRKKSKSKSKSDDLIYLDLTKGEVEVQKDDIPLSPPVNQGI